MKKIRFFLLPLAVIIIACELYFIDYSDLFVKENAGSLLCIFSMAMLIISIILSNKHDKNITQ
jgi:hypothetical protein